MKTDTLKSSKSQAGDIEVKRKLDTVQVIRCPDVVLTTLNAEESIKLAHSLLDASDKILKASGVIDDA